ncbi:MAG: hypothetical protein ACE5GW_04865 [Planctomycetota bacterium]
MALALVALLAFCPAAALRSSQIPQTPPAPASPRGQEETSPELRRSSRPRPPSPEMEELEKAIRRGLDYLMEKQSLTGALSDRFPVAVTALGGLAFLGQGAVHSRGPYGDVIAGAVLYLTAPERRDARGFIRDGGENASRMHGHGYAILFLSQVVGGLPFPHREAEVRKVIRDGVKVIVESQTVRGGWGYTPSDDKDEASITVCCLQALRAAKDAGFEVPEKTIKGALRYLKDSCLKDGSFRYSLTRGRGTTSTYELTAAAVSTLEAAGEYAMEEHRKGVGYLLKTLEKVRNRRANVFDACDRFPFYGNLYAAQVYHQIGGEVWEKWSAEAWPHLLSQRDDRDGSWESRFGPQYATAMALLILEVPLGYLPIFER